MRRKLLAALAMLTCYFNLGAAELPVKYFSDFDDYESVTISPDGKHFAVRAVSEGKVVLVFIRREDMTITGGAKAPKKGHISSVRWVSNERVVYTETQDNGYLASPIGTDELHAINYDGSKNQTIFSDNAGFGIINLLPDEEDYILVAAYPYINLRSQSSRDLGNHTEIVKVDVNWGRNRTLYRLPLRDAYPLADESGLVRFAVADNLNDESRVFFRPNEDAEWQEQKLDTFGTQVPRPIALSADGSTALLSVESEEGGFTQLYSYELESQKLDLLYDSKGTDIDHWYFDPKTRLPVIAVTYPGKVNYEYLQPEHKLSKLHRSLVQAFPGQIVGFPSYTEDLNFVIVQVSGDKNPGEFYLYDVAANKARFLLARRSWVDQKHSRSMIATQFKARDDLEIPIYLTLAEGEDKPHPLIVIPHGGPFGIRDYWGYDSETQMLANHGFNVLQVNYRGSGGYGEDFEVAGHLEWGKKMQDDITDATRWAIQEGYAQADKICIYGGSYGAYAAMMGAIREPELYRCAVGYSGVYDLPLMFKEGWYQLFGQNVELMKRTIGEPGSALNAVSPVHLAGQINVPVFLAHGGKDIITPPEHAEHLRDALKSAGKDPEWLFYRNELHGFYDAEHREEFYTKLLAFFNKHLGS